jgi:hypothetical protein
MGVRVALLPEIREIEPAGAAADHGDTQDLFLPIGSILLIGPD